MQAAFEESCGDDAEGGDDAAGRGKLRPVFFFFLGYIFYKKILFIYIKINKFFIYFMIKIYIYIYI